MTPHRDRPRGLRQICATDVATLGTSTGRTITVAIVEYAPPHAPSLRISSVRASGSTAFVDVPPSCASELLAIVNAWRTTVVDAHGPNVTRPRGQSMHGTYAPPTSGETARRPHVAPERVAATETHEDPTDTTDAPHAAHEGR